MTRGRTVRGSGVQFHAVERSNLAPVAVVAQCLDAHWVPRTMLRRMVERGESYADVAGERLALVRSEYLRALVNAQQVVVERSSLYGNPVLVRALQSATGDREALGRLLETAAVIPFLGADSSPVADPGPEVDERAFTAWRRLCGEVRTHCLRLEWPADPADPGAVRDELRRRFGWFASGVHQLDVPTLSGSLDVAGEDEIGLRQRLAQVALWCADWAGRGRPITRDDLYREFVVAGGAQPEEGRYDRSRPFALEIKQLIDLQHSSNLPDVLGRLLLVPADSLQRPALQEWQQPPLETVRMSLAELSARIRAAAASPAPGGESIRSLGALSLVEVEAVRRTDAWAAYVEALGRLLASPQDFADPARGASGVCDRYARLMEVATSFARRRSPGVQTEHWAPVAELVVDVAGAALSVIPSLLGQDAAACRTAGSVSARAAGRAVPFSLTLVIRGLPERRSRADLTCAVRLFDGLLDDAAEQWAELLAAFGQAPPAEPAPSRLPAERSAVMERPGLGFL